MYALLSYIYSFIGLSDAWFCCPRFVHYCLHFLYVCILMETKKWRYVRWRKKSAQPYTALGWYCGLIVSAKCLNVLFELKWNCCQFEEPIFYEPLFISCNLSRQHCVPVERKCTGWDKNVFVFRFPAVENMTDDWWWNEERNIILYTWKVIFFWCYCQHFPEHNSCRLLVVEMVSASCHLILR